MQVSDKSSYISEIYSAIVVNADSDLDPKGNGRVQIYIPKVHFNYIDEYQYYMDDEYKSDNELFYVFPWSKTLIDNLENGDYVYGSYIDGDPSKFIILGVDSNPDYDEYSLSNYGFATTNLNDLSKLTDFALGIIFHNEIGVDINAWKNDSIPSSKYSTITLHDGGKYDNNTKQWIEPGSWSIGILQWNGARAYTTFYEIIKELPSWKNLFSDVNKNNGLILALESSLSTKSTSGQSYKFHSNYNPEVGGSLYNAIKSVLQTSISKNVQRDVAYNNTYDNIKMLYNEGCDNPAILIFMADFFNQYGNGYPDTIKKCVKACSKTELTTMEQLDWVIKNQLKKEFSDYTKYKNRRSDTYDYIEDLLEKGKLGRTPLTNEKYDYSKVFGKYAMPVTVNPYISAIWGPHGYTNHTNGIGTKYHTGVDFAVPSGTPLFACTSGTISVDSWSSTSPAGLALRLKADDTNAIRYLHMSKFVITSGRVNEGDLIGYSGNTGHSTGAHLHFEVLKGPNCIPANYYGTGGDIDPLPLLGLRNVKKNAYLY